MSTYQPPRLLDCDHGTAYTVGAAVGKVPPFDEVEGYRHVRCTVCGQHELLPVDQPLVEVRERLERMLHELREGAALSELSLQGHLLELLAHRMVRIGDAARSRELEASA